MINYRLKIDFLDSKTLASDICFVSGDVKSSTLYFEFYNAGKRVDISGYTLSVRAKRSDGVVVASSGKIKENTAVFTPESNMYCIPGELYIEVALSDSLGRYATTKIITAEVIEGLGEAAIDGADNLNVYVTLLNEAVLAKDEAKAAADVSNDAAQRAEATVAEALENARSAVFASALKAGASGEIVSITDVSPVEHNLGVKVSSDTITDLSTVTLTACGKNLFNNDTSLLKEITFTSKSGVQGTRIGYEPFALPAGTYTFTLNDLDTSLDKFIYGFIGDKDNKFIRSCSLLAGTTNHTPLTITINEGEYVCIYNGITTLSVSARTKEFNAVQIQLEVGEKATEYESYIEPTNYPVTTDGIVEGVKSIYPNTTLMTDANGVLIDCEYNKDINKAFAELQNAIISLGGNV